MSSSIPSKQCTHVYSDPWIVKEGPKNVIQSLRDLTYPSEINLVHRVIEVYSDRVEVTEYFEPKYELKKIGLRLRTKED